MEPKAQLVISLMPDGNIAVQGPLPNKLLCYSMLEAAKDAVREYHQQQAASPIVQVPAMPGLKAVK